MPRQINEAIPLLQQRTKLLLWQKQDCLMQSLIPKENGTYYQKHMKPIQGPYNNWNNYSFNIYGESIRWWTKYWGNQNE